jgi:hypothetical protein
VKWGVHIFLLALAAIDCRAYGIECLRQTDGSLLLRLPETLVQKIESRIHRGLSVTIKSSVEARTQKTSFGCTIKFDPWAETMTILPFGASPLESKDRNAWIRQCFLTRGLSLPVKSRVQGIFEIDPVSQEQIAKTRLWLAERGIGGRSDTPLGQAVGALVDLRAAEREEFECDY